MLSGTGYVRIASTGESQEMSEDFWRGVEVGVLTTAILAALVWWIAL